jgi:PD-(D/E)XK nuclease superfamily
VDLNLLYERWCALQLVNAIISLRFEPDGEEALGFVVRVLRMTSEERRTSKEKLIFKRGALSVSVQIEPEKQTSNGPRRPDFFLEISGGAQTETVVFDVKCKQFAESLDEGDRDHNSLSTSSNEIRNMYFGPDKGGKRNYSMGGANRVFLLHPCCRGIPEPSSYQHWSANSFYGERYAYDWQNDDAGPDHRYGAVYLRPGQVDDLRRLLGMLLNMATLPPLKGEVESDNQRVTHCILACPVFCTSWIVSVAQLLKYL